MRRQEMQKHELDCYSDCGFPTRPRPKVILSIPRAGSHWSAHHASKLQTVPVRVGQHINGTVRQRAQRASIGSPFQGTSSEKTYTAERRRQLRRSLGASETESGGGSVSESDESFISTVGYYHNGKGPSGGSLKAKVSNYTVTPLEPPALTRVRKERLGLSLSWPSPSEDERDTGERRNARHNSNEMSNRSRIHSRRSNAAEREEPTFASSPKSGGKKSRKPSRALTFSFGSSSEKVRRGLGFLHSKVTRKPSHDESQLQRLPESHLAVQSSPILQSKRKSQTMPVISRSTEFQRHCILEEERDSDSSQDEDWGPDLTSPHRNRHTHKHVPHPPPINPSLSAPCALLNGVAPRTDSPAYSQNSGLSSRQDSTESLTSSVSSRQESPNMLTMPRQSKRERRKLSDPNISDRDSIISNGGEEAAPKGGSSTLKKRYTFCVRPSKQSPRPGWVS